MEVMASGLLIPEGPVALSDGSALVVELGDGRLSGEVAATASGHIMSDSFAVEAGGHVCIGSIGRGGYHHRRSRHRPVRPHADR
ncbi:hypothetical protein A8G00_08490 [Sphingobium sp. SA916]|nr:hypothetical protein A8G00_08490 [Sphingobium sp. SA916]